MDLGICPRCGKEWTPGSETCSECGFVPIGAGLKGVPKATPNEPTKKQSYRVGRPRSSGRAVFAVATLSILILSWVLKPWVNDWEQVRVLFGDQHSRNLEGSWAIVKSVLIDPAQSVTYHDNLTGTFSFNKAYRVDMALTRGTSKFSASGDYAQHGPTLLLRHLQTDSNPMGVLPGNFSANLSWIGQDSVVAEFEPNEVLYLQRLP